MDTFCVAVLLVSQSIKPLIELACNMNIYAAFVKRIIHKLMCSNALLLLMKIQLSTENFFDAILTYLFLYKRLSKTRKSKNK